MPRFDSSSRAICLKLVLLLTVVGVVACGTGTPEAGVDGSLCAPPPATHAFRSQIWGVCTVTLVSIQTCRLDCDSGETFSTAGLQAGVALDGAKVSLGAIEPGMEIQFWAVQDTTTLLGIRAYSEGSGREAEYFRD
jgi:hypothetical protein